MFFFFLIISCTDNNKEKNRTPANNIIHYPPKIIATVLTPSSFPQQILSNGTLKATRTAALFFKTDGTIETINVKNGDKVKKGFILSTLENGKYLLGIEKANEQLNFAKTELNSLLLGFGGKEGDTCSVNRDLLQNLKSQSGYNMAKINLFSARLAYQNTFLKAPFSGRIAGIEKQTGERIDPSKPFCTLLDDSRFTVKFKIMEQDLGKIRLGQTIKVYPIAYDTFFVAGRLSEINPVVDRNGLIQIKAQIEQSDINKNLPALLSGMNVKVVVEKFLPNRLFVPKSAVVLRSNKPVVFTYSAGKAKWHYVVIGGENTTSYLITKGLQAGDTIIISGNLNLAHDADVNLTEIK